MIQDRGDTIALRLGWEEEEEEDTGRPSRSFAGFVLLFSPFLTSPRLLLFLF